MRTEQEIREQNDAAYDVTVTGGTTWPGMTYEEGVAAALSWALQDNDDKPMQDD